MIQLLFLVILFEGCLIMLIMFKTPLRKLVIMGLDRIKRGRGPIMVKTVSSTIFIVLISNLYSLVHIKNRLMDEPASNPTDQILFANYLLESSLMGCTLFLVLMIDRQHHYIRELHLRRKAIEAMRKENRGFENEKTDGTELKALDVEMNNLKARLGSLQSELMKKSKDVTAAETNAIALRKQSEGFLHEYDRLLEENQNLRTQLQLLDRKSSHSGNKKNS